MHEKGNRPFVRDQEKEYVKGREVTVVLKLEVITVGHRGVSLTRDSFSVPTRRSRAEGGEIGGSRLAYGQETFGDTTGSTNTL